MRVTKVLISYIWRISIPFMVSILIPAYHYNAFPLAEEIEKQALTAGIVFELICIDDGSFSKLNIENQKINYLTNCKFIESKTNVGRTVTRQKLADMAQYEWLLLLDADIFPKEKSFLKKFISEININVDLLFGGIAYKKVSPNPNKKLRWHYGSKRESKNLSERIKKPYLSVISGSIFIRKKLFQEINCKMQLNKYGLDIYFASLLKNYRVKVKHIDNPVFHLGIEDSKNYLLKSKEALNTLYILEKENKININMPILRTYRILKFFGLAKITGTLINKKAKKIETNLLSSNPNLLLFDLYRLAYFCRIKA